MIFKERPAYRFHLRLSPFQREVQMVNVCIRVQTFVFPLNTTQRYTQFCNGKTFFQNFKVFFWWSLNALHPRIYIVVCLGYCRPFVGYCSAIVVLFLLYSVKTKVLISGGLFSVNVMVLISGG